MSDSRSVSVRLSADVTQYIANLKQAAKETEAATRTIEGTAAKQRAAFTTVGNAAGKLGLIGAAAFTGIVAVTANFDKAMSAVQAATHESSDSMELLRQAAIKAGADTTYSASESAGAIEELAKAGVSTADILGGGLSGALNLAAAGAIDVTDAAETAASAMTQFGLAGDQVNHIADLLSAGAGKAQGGVDDLGMALKQSGLVAAQTGLSIEETVGALSEFASAGLIGSDAGTSFKTMLMSLNPNSDKAAELMESLGLSAYDAQGNFVGMANYAGQLQEALGRLSVEQQNAALKTIFGSDAVRAASIIFKDGAQGVTDWQDKVDDAGYAADTAATRMDNLAGDVEQLRGSLETAFIGMGEGAQGPLRTVTQSLTDTVNAFNELPGPIKTATTAGAGFMGVFGGATWLTTRTINGLETMRDTMTNFGFSAETASRSTKALGRTMGAAAGIGSFVVGVENANRVVGTLETTMGGAATGLAVGGPWGAAVGGAIGLVVGLGKSHDDTKARVQALTDTFDQQTGAITDNTRAKVANDAQEQGLLDAAEQLGIKTALVTDAILGSAEAQRQLNAELAGYDVDHTISSADDLRDSFSEQEIQAILANRAATKLRDTVPGMADDFDQASQDAKQLARGMKDSGEAAGNYGTAARRAALDSQELRDEMRKSREEARGVAQQFLGLADSVDDSKVSLDEWIADLKEQADALRDFRVNAQQAADKGLRKGLIDALEEAGPAGALRMKQLADATDAEIARANKAWASQRREMQAWVNFKVPPKDVDINTDPAARSIAEIERMLAGIPNAIHTNYYVNTVRTATKPELHAPAGADGMTVPGPRHPYGDKILAYLAPGEEVITNRHGEADQFRADRASGRIPAYAAGGTVGAIQALADGGRTGLGGSSGNQRSLDDRLTIAQLMQQIRDYQRDLDATIKKGPNKGQHQVQGLDRELLQLQMQTARRDLDRAKHADERELAATQREQRQAARQAEREHREEQAETRATLKGSIGSLFDGIFPKTVTFRDQVSDAIDDFQQQWLAAGGKWTSVLKAWAQSARDAAAQYDEVTASIEAETAVRDALEDTLSTQKSQLDELNSAMASYVDAVASNFLTNPFNGAHTETVAGAAGPATAALQAAMEQLAQLRQSATGDSIEAAARAADLIEHIKDLQDAADAETSDTEVQVSGLAALRSTLQADTANAQAMTAALQTLADKGLDTAGDLGGLYKQLAASGDLGTAQEMAALSSAQIDELEKAFKARDDATGALSALAGNSVYGGAIADIQGQMQQTQSSIDTVNASIELMTAALPTIADEVKVGAESGANILHPDLSSIATSSADTVAATANIDRQFSEYTALYKAQQILSQASSVGLAQAVETSNSQLEAQAEQTQVALGVANSALKMLAEVLPREVREGAQAGASRIVDKLNEMQRAVSNLPSAYGVELRKNRL